MISTSLILVRVFYNALYKKDNYIAEETPPCAFYESLHHMGINRGFFSHRLEASTHDKNREGFGNNKFGLG